MPSEFHDRRRFLIRCARALAAMTLAGWQRALVAGTEQAAAGAGLRVIDTHTHFYDPTRPQGVPWPPPDDKLLYRRVLPQDYRARTRPPGVTATVAVEASPWLEDNQWVLDLAAQDAFIVGFVGNLPVGAKSFAGHLKRFSANPIFRGIRLSGDKLDGAPDKAAFLSDVKLLAANDLSLDLVGGMEILSLADRLSQEIPGLRIIIDHLAGVAIDGKAPPEDWVRQMRALSKRPGVFCKVSGLVEGTGRSDGTAPGDAEFYRPVLDVMRESFGPERLIYASNWPVSERFAPLSRVEGIIVDYCRSHERRAEEWIFWRSAKAAYRLPAFK